MLSEEVGVDSHPNKANSDLEGMIEADSDLEGTVEADSHLEGER